MPQTYVDFELEIGPPTGQQYPITLLRSPAGEARATLDWPFGELALENRLKDLQIALLSSGGVRRTFLTPAETTVQRFGAELFDLLIRDEVRSRYDVSQERANQSGAGLRIKLRIHDPQLATLPWEYLHDPRSGEYLCLSRQTPLVRYLELPQVIRPLAVTPPLRILGMIAAPTDQQGLDVQVERQRLELAVAPLQEDGLVELHWLKGATWRDLQRTLRRGHWHIFHFIGHGDFDPHRDEGLVLFCHPNGRGHPFTAGDLGRLLADHRTLRLAVLNACLGAQGSTRDLFSSTAATLVRRGIPAVVAMQQAITDGAAIEFTQTFYESLADGLPVDAAMSEARKAISFAVANTLEWGTPVLYSRAPDGELFDLTEQDRRGTGSGGPINTPVEPPPAATPRARPAETPIAFDWVTILAGEFIMGSDKAKDKDAYDAELPQFSLYLPEYQIARVPVTVAQFQQFIAATGHQTTADVEGKAYVYTGSKWEWVEGANWAHPRGPQSNVDQKADHPVTCISWADAVAFCEWAKVRLPTEAEWEKAARGTEGQVYPWGNDEPTTSHCNFNMNKGDTTPVGTYPKGASPYGCLDMAGNVWEWTSTKWTSNYANYVAVVDNSLTGNESRVVRGGSFGNNLRYVRCAVRLDFGIWFSYVGVRVVRLSPGS